MTNRQTCLAGEHLVVTVLVESCGKSMREGVMITGVGQVSHYYGDVQTAASYTHFCALSRDGSELWIAIRVTASSATSALDVPLHRVVRQVVTDGLLARGEAHTYTRSPGRGFGSTAG